MSAVHVIGDVHGEREKLRDLLRGAGFTGGDDRWTGADSRLCGRGVLVYRVSATPFTPAPIQVLRSGSDRDLFRVDRCAPAYDAAVGPGSAVFDAAAQARVDVLGSSAAGYRVAVTYGASAARPAKKRLARRG